MYSFYTETKSALGTRKLMHMSKSDLIESINEEFDNILDITNDMKVNIDRDMAYDIHVITETITKTKQLVKTNPKVALSTLIKVRDIIESYDRNTNLEFSKSSDSIISMTKELNDKIGLKENRNSTQRKIKRKINELISLYEDIGEHDKVAKLKKI